MSSFGLVTSLGLLVTLAGCSTLPVIEADVCGNAVKEDGEQCDTFIDKDDAGAVCRPPGVVGECHFDCERDSEGNRLPCPQGLGCAPDGICREFKGEFQLPKLNLSSDVSSWLSATDFDGDGRADVISAEPTDQLQQARFRLHYFDADSKLVETRIFPRSSQRPIARQLVADAPPALLFTNSRVGMIPGRADREWIPASFSSYVVPHAGLKTLSISDDLVGNALALVAFTSVGEGDGVYVPAGFGGRLEPAAELEQPISKLAGLPLAANIVEGPDSPCAEVLFAFKGDSLVHLLDLCQHVVDLHADIDWRKSALEQVVRLPSGARIDSAPVAADVDGDGHLDVLVGAGGRAFLAHGDGTRLESHATSFEALQFRDNPNPDDPEAEPVDVPSPVPMPLAAGDVTGDGLADLVEPDGIWGSRRSPIDGSIHYILGLNRNTGQPWTMAQVVDLNGNDLPDVIAATAGAPVLSFFSGSKGQFLVSARINTQGPVRLLAAGDFDGDLIRDVALLESGPPKNPTDSLAVAFGDRDRVPLSPVRIAELSGVDQLGRQPDAGLDDIFTTSTEQFEGAPRSTFTLFGGDSARLPIAPYSLVTFSQDGDLIDWAAEALVVGSFTAPKATDVIAIGAKDLNKAWTQWLIPDLGSRRTPPQQLGMPPVADDILPVAPDGAGNRLSVAGTAADLDGDQLDEAIWLMPRGPEGCSLLIYDIDYDNPSLPQAVLKQQLDLDEPCATPELVASDLHQDHGVQLLALLGDPRQGPRRIEIFHNDGHGGFSVDDRSIVGDGEEDVRAFSIFPQEPPRLAFVTESALHIAATGENDRIFDDITTLKTTFDDARAVVVTDPNGDNLPDILVADAEGLWLLGAKLE